REALAAGEAELLELWRRRALITGVVMGALAVAGLGMLAREAPPLWRSVSAGWVLEVASALCGGGAVLALALRRYTAAVLLTAGSVTTVMLGWMLAQYPLLVPPALTLEAAKAPDRVIWYSLAAAGAGGVLLLPAMLFLFDLFKWGPERERKRARRGLGA
ncbi:MAG: hypothetical protein KDB35_22725, partial [Acidimicrobiales bacterium]|nr:hypothetical protein [Acidimicrobiales bacterium]